MRLALSLGVRPGTGASRTAKSPVCPIGGEAGEERRPADREERRPAGREERRPADRAARQVSGGRVGPGR